MLRLYLTYALATNQFTPILNKHIGFGDQSVPSYESPGFPWEETVAYMYKLHCLAKQLLTNRLVLVRGVLTPLLTLQPNCFSKCLRDSSQISICEECKIFPNIYGITSSCFGYTLPMFNTKYSSRTKYGTKL